VHDITAREGETSVTILRKQIGESKHATAIINIQNQPNFSAEFLHLTLIWAHKRDRMNANTFMQCAPTPTRPAKLSSPDTRHGGHFGPHRTLQPTGRPTPRYHSAPEHHAIFSGWVRGPMQQGAITSARKQGNNNSRRVSLSVSGSDTCVV
jgi:hypothetical protein